MKTLISMLLILFAAQSFGCDLTAGVGQTRRATEGKTGAVGSIACLYNEKWELRGTYFGEQRIYKNELVIHPYPMLSVSRVWLFRPMNSRFRPLLSAGISLKGADRCDKQGEIDCNRLTPLPFCFLLRTGAYVGDLVVSLNHCSNAGFDHGSEKKNLGQDYLMLELRF